MKSVALRPRKRNSGIGRDCFRFGDAGTEPSIFDLQFVVEKKLYRFGFSVDDQRIIEEWLVHIEGGREKVIYERITDQNGKVLIEAPGLHGQKLKALVTVGGPQNQSFLATVNATLDPDDVSKDLRDIIDWFGAGLIMIAPNESFRSLGYALIKDSDFLSFAGHFLKSSSTGVDHLDAQKITMSEEELSNLIPKSILTKIIEDFEQDEISDMVIRLPNGNELLIEQEDDKNYYQIVIQAAHEAIGGRTVSLKLQDESDGTIRLLNLLPALHHLRTSSAVYFIDEIDRSMHPILVLKFLEFFLNSCESGQRQVIVTTHESNLLDLDLLRRDEIWFAEKDSEGATRLYSLADFKVRKDQEIRKHYLQGRFGAIPFLGNLDKLQQEQEQRCQE
jgi:hypothetical protein